MTKRRHKIFLLPRVRTKRRLRNNSTINQTLEINHVLRDKFRQPRHIANAKDAQVFLRRKEVHHAWQKVWRNHHLGIILNDELGRLHITLAIKRNSPTKRRKPVRLIRTEVRLRQSRTCRNPARIVMLHNDGARLVHQIPQNVERVIRVRHIRFTWVLPALQQLRHRRQITPRLQQFHIAQNEIPIHQPIQRRLLPRVLTIPQTLLLAPHVPRHLLVMERLPRRPIDERNFHRRRKVVGFNRLISFLQIFHFVSSLK